MANTGKKQSVIQSIMIEDASNTNWADRFAPVSWLPFLRLARVDRPIGVWLLMWPCWWGATLASMAGSDPLPNLWQLFLFALGAWLMRSAGCAYNDIIDRNIDAQVKRTRMRPLPSGQITLTNAWLLFGCLILLGLMVLLWFNLFTIKLALVSLVIVMVYPFAKRLIDWPQVVLSLVFSWGALVGWSARFGDLSLPAILLYFGAIFWTMAYDTIYACQDIKDDSLIGVRSTARKLGADVSYWIAGFFLAQALFIAMAGWLVGGGILYLALLVPAFGHIIWQLIKLNPDDPNMCLRLFRSNRQTGGLIFFALLVSNLAG